MITACFNFIFVRFWNFQRFYSKLIFFKIKFENSYETTILVAKNKILYLTINLYWFKTVLKVIIPNIIEIRHDSLSKSKWSLNYKFISYFIALKS